MHKPNKPRLLTRRQRKSQDTGGNQLQPPAPIQQAIDNIASAIAAPFHEAAITMERTLRNSRRLLNWNVDDLESRELKGALRWLDIDGSKRGCNNIRRAHVSVIMEAVCRLGIAFRAAEEIFVEAPELCDQFFKNLHFLMNALMSTSPGHEVDNEQSRRDKLVRFDIQERIEEHCRMVSKQTFAENPQRYSMKEAVFLGYADSVAQYYAFNLPDESMEWIRRLMSEGIYLEKCERMKGTQKPATHDARMWLREVLEGHGSEDYTRFMKMACDCVVLAEYGMLTGRWTKAQEFTDAVIDLVRIQERAVSQAHNNLDGSSASPLDIVAEGGSNRSRLETIAWRRRVDILGESDSTECDDEGSAEDSEHEQQVFVSQEYIDQDKDGLVRMGFCCNGHSGGIEQGYETIGMNPNNLPSTEYAPFRCALYY